MIGETLEQGAVLHRQSLVDLYKLGHAASSGATVISKCCTMI